MAKVIVNSESYVLASGGTSGLYLHQVSSYLPGSRDPLPAGTEIAV